MTAVAGNYDPHEPICEDDGDEEQYVREQESFGEGPFDVYLHGNSAMMLNRMKKQGGNMKVVISSTKGIFTTHSKQISSLTTSSRRTNPPLHP